MSDADEPPDAFGDVLSAASALLDMPDVARGEAWASSVLSVWREDDEAAAIDDDFIAWLGTQQGVPAAVLRLVVASLLGIGLDAGALGDAVSSEAPSWVTAVGTATATRAWRVRADDAQSLAIGFGHADGSELSLLADVEADTLISLVVGPGPDELFDGSEDLIDITPCDVTEAASVIVAAWRRRLAEPEPFPDLLLVNLMIGRARLRAVLGEPLDDLLLVPGPVAAIDDLDPAERAEANGWARALLVGALRLDSDVPAERVTGELVDVLTPEGISRYPAEEREAFASLEWADWLGAVIGTVRAGAGTAVTGQGLVDAVNRCPEVTSSIPKSDRPYFAWAFQHVLAVWARTGVLEDGLLTAEAVDLLPAALLTAWAAEPGQ